MLFGPIVFAEMIKTARQKRWYVLRVFLGLGLLFVIYQNTQWSNIYRYPGSSPTFSHEELQFMAMRLFYYLMVGQAVVILLLTPALTAGSIAEEKQRKTLHYLLASRLTSLEIVVGKLAARLLLIAMPVAISLPVMVMLSLFGGIDLTLVFVGYAAIASTALLEGSLAILISTLMRRGREALLLTFLVVLAWLFAPVILESTLTNNEPPWPAFYYRWIAPINSHLIELGPFCLRGGPNTRFSGPNGLAWALGTMLGHQLVVSIFLLAVATLQLRPAFRRQDGAPALGKGLTRLIRAKIRRWRPRRPCGDEAMLWKETYGSSGSMLLTLVSYLSVLGVGLCAFQALREAIPLAWNSLVQNGYNVGNDRARHDLTILLRAMNTGLFCVLGLILATLASTSVSREREDDTWISLISTPLDGSSILFAKLVGSLWAMRVLFVTMAFIWLFGLVMGSFHPLGIVLSVLHLVIFTLFILALGTLISLRARTTMRAVGLTFGILLFLSLIVPIMAEMLGIRSMKGWVTSLPFQFVMGMLSYRDVGVAITGTIPMANPLYEREFLYNLTLVIIIGTIGYLIAGGILLSVAYRAFDHLLDRPRRAGMHLIRFPAVMTPDLTKDAPAEIPVGRA